MDMPHTSHGSSLSLQRPTRSLCCVYQQTPHMRCRVCFIQNSLVQSLTNFQALDVIGFAQFKQKYKSQMEERALNSGPISKGEFLEAIEGPYIEAFTQKNVRKAFETVGTWPVDPSKITRRMLGPSKALSIKAVSVIPQTSPIKHIVNNLTLLASRPTSNPAFLSKDSSTPSPAPDSTPLVCETNRLDDVKASLTNTRAGFLFDGSQASSSTMVPHLELPARHNLIPSILKLKLLPKNLADLDWLALVSLAQELHSDAAESCKHIKVLVLNQDTLTAQNALL